MTKPNFIFLKPFLEQRVWGGTKLKEFNYEIPENQLIGEAWTISAYENKASTILNDDIKEKDFYHFFKNNKDLFDNYENDKYPLLVKILDCQDDLSVQVHPDDHYAKIHHNDLGKNECWYILDAKPDASIIYGHKAKTKKELENFVNKKQWNDLLLTKKVRKGDLVYVPAGTVHAVKGGLFIYELQQSSNVTYRLYDYDRELTNPERKLHIKESLENIVVPFNIPEFGQDDHYLVNNDKFTLLRVVNNNTNTYSCPEARWVQVSVIVGEGVLENNKTKLKAGDNFIITSLNKNKEMTITGNIVLLISYIR